MSTSKIPICACGPCRPKWMKMVDNIYTSNPEYSKLTHFCIRKPDKLNRIASYLHKKMYAELSRRNYLSENINISMEAINALMNSCQAERLNLFDVCFLKMVIALLGTSSARLQILATISFAQFAQIQEDSTNYHQEYDVLISHFTSMAVCTSSDDEERIKTRLHGINGIRGIIHKTLNVRDQLLMQRNVLQAASMNKIIPALLFNIREGFVSTTSPNGTSAAMLSEDNGPSTEAVFVFKDIVFRASFLNIEPVVDAILTNFDSKNLWSPSAFPLMVFEYLLDSLKNPQLAHNLVRQLVEHLKRHESDSTVQVRIGIVQVIGRTVSILAKETIGPDVFHNFNALLQILRSNIEKTQKAATIGYTKTVMRDQSTVTAKVILPPLVSPGKLSKDFNSLADSQNELLQSLKSEQQFQDVIIKTIAEFAKNLSEPQKIEILKFILNFNFDSDSFLRANKRTERSKSFVRVLMKTMLLVAEQYQCVTISNALHPDFLRNLLRGVAIDRDPGIRIYVQKILHTLMDRNRNTEKLLRVRIYPDGTLVETCTWERPDMQDILFMKNTGVILTENLFSQMLDPTNKVDNFEHLACTISLIALEMSADEVLLELFRLMLAVQDQLYLETVANDEDTPRQSQSQSQDDEADLENDDSEDNLTEDDSPRVPRKKIHQYRKIPNLPELPKTHSCAVHAIVASCLTLLIELMGERVPSALKDHIYHTIEIRQTKATYILPEVAFNRGNTPQRNEFSEESYPKDFVLEKEYMFDRNVIANTLEMHDFDVSGIDVPYQIYDQQGSYSGHFSSYHTTLSGANVSFGLGGSGSGAFTSSADRTDSITKRHAAGMVTGSSHNAASGHGGTGANLENTSDRNSAMSGKHPWNGASQNGFGSTMADPYRGLNGTNDNESVSSLSLSDTSSNATNLNDYHDARDDAINFDHMKKILSGGNLPNTELLNNQLRREENYNTMKKFYETVDFTEITNQYLEHNRKARRHLTEVMENIQTERQMIARTNLDNMMPISDRGGQVKDGQQGTGTGMVTSTPQSAEKRAARAIANKFKEFGSNVVDRVEKVGSNVGGIGSGGARHQQNWNQQDPDVGAIDLVISNGLKSKHVEFEDYLFAA